MKSILGKKLDMSQIYAADGSLKPVTAVQVGPCYVTQVRTTERDGYTSVQFGFGEKKHVSKALRGHFAPSKVFSKDHGFRYVRETRLDSVEGIEKGDVVDAGQFEVGERVQVVGWSKGKGFQGVVKRHHFHGHPTSHGHKDQERMPGSIGAGGNQHVFKGLRMAGRMGNDRVTVTGLNIIDIDYEKGILYIKGAVPGARNGLVIVEAEGVPVFKKALPYMEVKESEVSKDLASAVMDEEEEKIEKPDELAEEAPSQIAEVEKLVAHVEASPANMSSEEMIEEAAHQAGSPQEEAEQSIADVASADELSTDVDEATGEVKPQE